MAEINLTEIECDSNSPLEYEYGKTLLTQKGGWTAEELGITLDGGDEGQEYTKQDFYGDLKKISRRENIPIGENIRDAIRSIKGK